MRRHIMSLVLMAGLWTAPFLVLADSDAEANRLFVEAVKLHQQAEAAGETDGARELYEQVKANVQRIVDDNPSSSLAVRVLLGEPLGPMVVGQFELLP